MSEQMPELSEDDVLEIYHTVRSYNKETPSDTIPDYGLEVAKAQREVMKGWVKLRSKAEMRAWLQRNYSWPWRVIDLLVEEFHRWLQEEK